MKLCNPHAVVVSEESRPARGAWIEIHLLRRHAPGPWGAPRKGRVDCNYFYHAKMMCPNGVAPRKGRVD